MTTQTTNDELSSPDTDPSDQSSDLAIQEKSLTFTLDAFRKVEIKVTIKPNTTLEQIDEPLAYGKTILQCGLDATSMLCIHYSLEEEYSSTPMVTPPRPGRQL